MFVGIIIIVFIILAAVIYFQRKEIVKIEDDLDAMQKEMVSYRNLYEKQFGINKALKTYLENKKESGDIKTEVANEISKISSADDVANILNKL